MPFNPVKSTPTMSRRETNSLTAHATVCFKKRVENETESNYYAFLRQKVSRNDVKGLKKKK
jgi:hypothetical protein